MNSETSHNLYFYLALAFIVAVSGLVSLRMGDAMTDFVSIEAQMYQVVKSSSSRENAELNQEININLDNLEEDFRSIDDNIESL